MIKAKMLNEMNPKLRKILGSAALAAALGMGTVGCSTPNDDYSEPLAIEQPAPENPGETETENVVTFETLGVADFAESLAGAIKKSSSTIVDTPFTDLVYDVNEHGFVLAEFDIDGDFIGNATGYIRYVSPSDKISYYIPESMESDFDTAITAYKAAHAE